jgi:hypothetical protein
MVSADMPSLGIAARFVRYRGYGVVMAYMYKFYDVLCCMFGRYVNRTYTGQFWSMPYNLGRRRIPEWFYNVRS